MKKLYTALLAEFMKLRRSKIFLITICLFAFIPLMIGLMMYISQNPEIIMKLGIIGTKAQLFSENNWEGYIEVINQLIAILGLIGFGFVTSWVFGGEYMEHTIIDILSLPVPRSAIVTSKFLIIFLWCSLLSIVLFAVAISLGRTKGTSQP